MANRQVGAILHHLSKLVDKETATQLTDGQLLQRFSAHRDEDAFAALMQRHSGLVYGVCRHILHQEQDAEDAFQSTFLVLARQAGSIRRQTAVGSWLYQVAFRIAVKVRKATVRRRERETQAAQPEEEHPSSELSWRELQAILDEELNCLPEKYRAPFVLCCLTGKSKPEAAAELGWKEGTVSSRLAHARELLQKRLARRGVTLSAVLCGLAVAPHAGLAAVPAPLIAATLKAAMSFVAGVPTAGAASAQALACAHAMLRAMVVARLAWVAAVLAVMGLVVGVAAVVAPRTPPEAPKAASQAPAPNPKQGPQPAREGRGAAEVKPATPDRGQRMTVGGRVLGVDGNPIPGVRVAAVAAQYQTPGEINGPASLNMQLLGEGQADEQGQFLIAVPQTTAAHYRLTALATAPGYALTSRMVDHYRVTAPEHTVPLTLVRARDVRGRLVDLQGAPAAGVRVHVLGISRGEPGAVFFQFGEPPVRLPGWPDSAV
ncbi:MAG TPA: sigma-70 family RNA polymerase sigma factor, partial [Gemmataceae bacterium]|nr:sigma-70 family RNA polymerase sigma factor [Gemmataceae bacterium]